MRDHKTGTPTHQGFERGLNVFFGGCVHAAGRFVQDEQPWIGQQRPRKRDDLALTDAQVYAVFADIGLVAVVQFADEFVCANRSRRRFDFGIGGIESPVPNVVGDRAAKQKRILQYDSKLAAQTGLGHVANVVAVYRQAAVGQVEEAAQQANDRAFARASFADQRNCFAGFGFQVNPVQHHFAIVVAKRHVLEFDVAGNRWQFDGIGRVQHIRRSIQQGKNAFG